MWSLLPCSLSWTLGADCCTHWTLGILASSLFSCIDDMGLDRRHESACRCTLGCTTTIVFYCTTFILHLNLLA